MRRNKHNKQVILTLAGITKYYTIHHEKPLLFDEFMRVGNERFPAVKNVRLTVYKGEKIGILGPNGSGKTTLLKLVSGIIVPTSGRLVLGGTVVPIIDAEAGFHPDLTGEQNIYLNGLIMGMTRKEIRQQLFRIIEFAELGRFIDVPFYTYSQGMKLRLGLAIALYANPDILLLDEGIGAGDKEFQKKVQAKVHELFTSGMTVMIASHWLGYLKKYCTRILIMDHGRIIADGTTKLVGQYTKMKFNHERILHVGRKK